MERNEHVKTITIRVPKPMWEALKKQSSGEFRTIAQQVIKYISEGLEREGR